MDESVKYYIEQARRSGYNDFEVRQALLSAGWNQEFVDLLLGQMPGKDTSAVAQQRRTATLKEWVKGYFKTYSAQIAVLTGLSVLAVLLSLFEPWAIKFLLDSVFDTVSAPGPLKKYTGTIRLLTIVSFMLLFVYIAEHVVKLAARRLSNKYSYEFDRILKTQFFGHVMRLPLKYRNKLMNDDYFFEQVSVASSDLTRIVMEIPVVLFTAGLGVLAAFIILLSINIPLAIMSFLILPAIFGVTRMFAPNIQASKLELDDHKKSIKSHVSESVQNMKIVQIFSKQDKQTTHLLDLMDLRFHSVIRSIHVTQGYEFVRGLIVIVGIFTIVYVGGRQIFQQDMTVGELFIFVYYINRFYGPLEVLSKGTSELNTALNRVQKFYDMLVVRTDVDTQEKQGVELPTFSSGIQFDKAQIVRDESVILQNVSLNLSAGQKIGLTGPTGAGRTTFLDVLPQLTEYNAGSIKVDGLELNGINIKSLRSQMTILNAEPQLFSDTILNNILYAVDRTDKEISSQDVVNAVNAAGALQFIEGLPNNYDTDLAQAAQFLTPAQQIRLALARAFLRNSPILLIDEPTETLDVQSEKEIMQTIFKLMEGKTVIMVSNKLSLLTQMNDVYVVDGGKVMNVKNYGGIDRYQSYLSTHELI